MISSLEKGGRRGWCFVCVSGLFIMQLAVHPFEYVRNVRSLLQSQGKLSSRLLQMWLFADAGFSTSRQVRASTMKIPKQKVNSRNIIDVSGEKRQHVVNDVRAIGETLGFDPGANVSHSLMFDVYILRS